METEEFYAFSEYSLERCSFVLAENYADDQELDGSIPYYRLEELWRHPERQMMEMWFTPVLPEGMEFED